MFKLPDYLGFPAFVAQRIEHLTTDQKVGGSSPSKRTLTGAWYVEQISRCQAAEEEIKFFSRMKFSLKSVASLVFMKQTRTLIYFREVALSSFDKA